METLGANPRKQEDEDAKGSPDCPSAVLRAGQGASPAHSVTVPEGGDEDVVKQIGVEQPLPKFLQPELIEEARLLALERGLGHLTARQCSEAIRLKQKGLPLFHDFEVHAGYLDRSCS